MKRLVIAGVTVFLVLSGLALGHTVTVDDERAPSMHVRVASDNEAEHIARTVASDIVVPIVRQ